MPPNVSFTVIEDLFDCNLDTTFIPADSPSFFFVEVVVSDGNRLHCPDLPNGVCLETGSGTGDPRVVLMGIGSELVGVLAKLKFAVDCALPDLDGAEIIEYQAKGSLNDVIRSGNGTRVQTLSITISLEGRHILTKNFPVGGLRQRILQTTLGRRVQQSRDSAMENEAAAKKQRVAAAREKLLEERRRRGAGRFYVGMAFDADGLEAPTDCDAAAMARLDWRWWGAHPPEDLELPVPSCVAQPAASVDVMDAVAADASAWQAETLEIDVSDDIDATASQAAVAVEVTVVSGGGALSGSSGAVGDVPGDDNPFECAVRVGSHAGRRLVVRGEGSAVIAAVAAVGVLRRHLGDGPEPAGDAWRVAVRVQVNDDDPVDIPFAFTQSYAAAAAGGRVGPALPAAAASPEGPSSTDASAPPADPSSLPIWQATYAAADVAALLPRPVRGTSIASNRDADQSFASLPRAADVSAQPRACSAAFDRGTVRDDGEARLGANGDDRPASASTSASAASSAGAVDITQDATGGPMDSPPDYHAHSAAGDATRASGNGTAPFPKVEDADAGELQVYVAVSARSPCVARVVVDGVPVRAGHIRGTHTSVCAALRQLLVLRAVPPAAADIDVADAGGDDSSSAAGGVAGSWAAAPPGDAGDPPVVLVVSLCERVLGVHMCAHSDADAASPPATYARYPVAFHSTYTDASRRDLTRPLHAVVADRPPLQASRLVVALLPLRCDASAFASFDALIAAATTDGAADGPADDADLPLTRIGRRQPAEPPAATPAVTQPVAPDAPPVGPRVAAVIRGRAAIGALIPTAVPGATAARVHVLRGPRAALRAALVSMEYELPLPAVGQLAAGGLRNGPVVIAYLDDELADVVPLPLQRYVAAASVGVDDHDPAVVFSAQLDLRRQLMPTGDGARPVVVELAVGEGHHGQIQFDCSDACTAAMSWGRGLTPGGRRVRGMGPAAAVVDLLLGLQLVRLAGPPDKIPIDLSINDSGVVRLMIPSVGMEGPLTLVPFPTPPAVVIDEEATDEVPKDDHDDALPLPPLGKPEKKETPQEERQRKIKQRQAMEAQNSLYATNAVMRRIDELSDQMKNIDAAIRRDVAALHERSMLLTTVHSELVALESVMGRRSRHQAICPVM